MPIPLDASRCALATGAAGGAEDHAAVGHDGVAGASGVCGWGNNEGENCNKFFHSFLLMGACAPVWLLNAVVFVVIFDGFPSRAPVKWVAVIIFANPVIDFFSDLLVKRHAFDAWVQNFVCLHFLSPVVV
jgi:hypothetical protein